MVKIKTQFVFFDTDKVIKAVDRGRRVSLSKIGAFMRTRAKGLIRRSKKSALRGQPPRSHVGTLKNLIYFGFDSSKRSVAVGPLKFAKGEAPGLLEFGGDAKRAGKSAHYSGNPFMRPALNAELQAGTIPKAFSNTVKR